MLVNGEILVDAKRSLWMLREPSRFKETLVDEDPGIERLVHSILVLLVKSERFVQIVFGSVCGDRRGMECIRRHGGPLRRRHEESKREGEKDLAELPFFAIQRHHLVDRYR